MTTCDGDDNLITTNNNLETRSQPKTSGCLPSPSPFLYTVCKKDLNCKIGTSTCFWLVGFQQEQKQEQQHRVTTVTATDRAQRNVSLSTRQMLNQRK